MYLRFIENTYFYVLKLMLKIESSSTVFFKQENRFNKMTSAVKKFSISKSVKKQKLITC